PPLVLRRLFDRRHQQCCGRKLGLRVGPGVVARGHPGLRHRRGVELRHVERPRLAPPLRWLHVARRHLQRQAHDRASVRMSARFGTLWYKAAHHPGPGTRMEFGYFTLSDNNYRDNQRTPNAFIADIIDEALYAEQLGMHSAWIGEHHFSTLGV